MKKIPLFLVFIFLFFLSIEVAHGQATTSPLSSANSTSTKVVDFSKETIEGVVTSIDEVFITLSPDRNSDGVRKIRIGNPGSILVTKDKEEVTLSDIEVGDAAIITYSTRATYQGNVTSSTTPELLVITTPEGRELSFTATTSLQVQFDVQRGVRATADGVPPVIGSLSPGTDVEVTVRKESIVSIEAYANGRLPRSGGWIMPTLGLLIILAIGGIFYVRGKRNDFMSDPEDGAHKN